MLRLCAMVRNLLHNFFLSYPLYPLLSLIFNLFSTIYYRGSPWTPEFCDWGFNLQRGSEDIKAKWNLIPQNTDVLITHGPPYGYGDRTMNPKGFRCGCEELLKNIQSREKPPRIHIFGHIHEDRGTWSDGKTLFVNASSCTFHYRPTNQAIVLHLPLDPNEPATVIES
jgi:hypothetical protein